MQDHRGRRKILTHSIRRSTDVHPAPKHAEMPVLRFTDSITIPIPSSEVPLFKSAGETTGFNVEVVGGEGVKYTVVDRLEERGVTYTEVVKEGMVAVRIDRTERAGKADRGSHYRFFENVVTRRTQEAALHLRRERK